MPSATHETARAHRPWLIGATAALLGLVGSVTPAAAESSVALERFEVQLWPDYDKPAALVMYRARLAAGTPIPAQVRFRIPAAVGDPHAVAYKGEGGRLLLAKHTRTIDGEWALVEITAQSREVQLEYYAPVLVHEGTRQVTYLWPGDMKVAAFVYGAMQPAAAASFSVTPPATETVTRADGLVVHTADLGAVPAGKELKVQLSYESDGSLSAGRPAPASSGVAPAPARQPARRGAVPASSGPPAPKVGGENDDFIIWLILGLAVAAGAVWVLYSGRGKPSAG